MATSNPAITMIQDDTDDYYGSSNMVSQSAEVHDFFATLLKASVMAHMLHLKTRSIAEHLALEEFYKELPDLVDTLIEGYQFKYGIVNDYPHVLTIPQNDNGVKLMEGLTLFIAEHREKVGPDTELQNQIDEIQMLINTTGNKLRFYS